MVALPMPPESLRVAVGPFCDPGLFARSGEEMAAEIISLCGLAPDARVLDLGCGCGRLSRALAGYLGSHGRYHGIDVAPELIDWCKWRLEPVLPSFHFSLADVHVPDFNPHGVIAATEYRFPFAADTFDLAIVSSLFTHMLPNEIAHYMAELSRVLKPRGRCFMSVLLFDEGAEVAVANGATIFDFRHPIGPCLTFDRDRPREGVACRDAWFFQLIDSQGLHIDVVKPGNWRRVRSYEIAQDYVVAHKL